MRLEQLIYLNKIAETGSLNMTSKQLFMTQQALSIAIAKLEEELGAPLLFRKRSGVSLTIDGEYVLSEAKQILNHVDNISNHFLRKKDISHVSLRISTTPVPERKFLSAPICYLYKEFPNIQLDVQAKTLKEVLQDISANRADIGFISVVSLNGNSGLDTLAFPDSCFTPFRASDISVLMNKSSSLAQYPTISIELLQSETIIMVKNINAEEDVVYKPFRNIPHISFVENEDLFLPMLENNLGVAFYNNLALSPTPLPPSLTLRPLEQKASITFYYVTNSSVSEQNPYISLLCDHLLSL